MVSSRSKTGLSRKVVGCYLLFSLLAILGLATAVVVSSHWLVAETQAKNLLGRLGRVSAVAEVYLWRKDFDGLSSQLTHFARNSQLAYCAVVGLDGRCLAHTDGDLIGKPAEEPVGPRSTIGDSTSVCFENNQGTPHCEYRVPLGTSERPLGELRVAIRQPNFWATVRAAAELAPLAVLAPAALLGAGALVLGRLSRPISELESQLADVARQPLTAELEPAPVTARSAAALGWNRVVDELQRCRRNATQGDVEDVLALAERERREAQFEQILQRLSDGIAVTDADGRIAFANRAIAALLGEDDEVNSLAGIQLDQKLQEVAQCPPESELLTPAARQRSAVGELVQKSGELERILRVARLPLGADGGQGHVWSLRDVTQQKLAEQTRDNFIDTATHELRTPLANIKAYAETLASAEYIDVELQKEFCNIINSEVTRLARFIDDLLSISSMEAGALSIERQKVETQRLFSEVLSKVEPLMQQKEIDFQVDMPPKMPELHLDKDKIVAVIVNILGNAAKYTPGGGRVSLKVKVEEGRLRAAVEDTGFGIAPEELEKVFEKFFRSEDPRVQAEVGTGLGLSLAREVVRMHGGELAVESELNKGSTFTMSLPLA